MNASCCFPGFGRGKYGDLTGKGGGSTARSGRPTKESTGCASAAANTGNGTCMTVNTIATTTTTNTTTSRADPQDVNAAVLSFMASGGSVEHHVLHRVNGSYQHQPPAGSAGEAANMDPLFEKGGLTKYQTIHQVGECGYRCPRCVLSPSLRASPRLTAPPCLSLFAPCRLAPSRRQCLSGIKATAQLTKMTFIDDVGKEPPAPTPIPTPALAPTPAPMSAPPPAPAATAAAAGAEQQPPSTDVSELDDLKGFLVRLYTLATPAPTYHPMTTPRQAANLLTIPTPTQHHRQPTHRPSPPAPIHKYSRTV